MFKEVIVVEGRDDTRRLKEIYPNIETLETNGSAISKSVLQQIKTLQVTRGVIVFTDPDFPGNKIRQRIIDEIPECKHAHVRKVDAIAKNKRGVGVEHASEEVIKEALANVMTPAGVDAELMDTGFLMQLGLIGHENSAKNREKLCEILGIGHVNAKQLRKRLRMFNITKEQIKEIFDEGYCNEIKD